MKIPDDMVLEAGAIMAHAAAAIAELEPDSLLFPYAILKRNGEFKILTLDGDTQEIAVLAGKAQIVKQQNDLDGWVFVADARFRWEDGTTVDALSAELWTKGMKNTVMFMQPYKRDASGKLTLLDDPILDPGSNMISEPRSRHLLSVLYQGTQRVDYAKGFWPSPEEMQKRQAAAPSVGWGARLKSLWSW